MTSKAFQEKGFKLDKILLLEVIEVAKVGAESLVEHEKAEVVNRAIEIVDVLRAKFPSDGITALAMMAITHKIWEMILTSPTRSH